MLRFYLADINFQNKKWADAYKLYEQIVSLPFNEYSEKSIVNSILSLQNLNQSADTEALLLKLKNITSYQENINFANSNLMILYMKNDQFDQAREISNEILNQKNIDLICSLNLTGSINTTT